MKLSPEGFYLRMVDSQEVYRLNRREVQCLVYLLEGKSSKQVGRILNISHRTVENYYQQLRERLGCYSRGELIEKVLTNHLVYSKSPEEHEQHLIKMKGRVNTLTNTLKQTQCIHV